MSLNFDRRPMTRRTNILSLVLGSCTLHVLALRATAQDSPVLVSNPQYGYSVRIPAGWQQVPADVLGDFAKSILMPDSKVIFEAAFQPVELENWFQYPYVLIQVSPYDRVGLDRAPNLTKIKRFVKELSGFDVDAQQENLTGEDRDMLSETSYHKAQFDPKRLRVAYDADLQVPDLGTVRGRALGQFGQTAFVQVVFYDIMDDWLMREDDRKTILQSLELGPDFVLTVDSSMWGDKTVRGAVAGGIGGALGAIGIVWIRRRKKRKSAA